MPKEMMPVDYTFTLNKSFCNYALCILDSAEANYHLTLRESKLAIPKIQNYQDHEKYFLGQLKHRLKNYNKHIDTNRRFNLWAEQVKVQ